MAPELAIETLQRLPKLSVVLDPMAGSGTVLRHASDMGHRAIGFDVDPLAVLISKVWTRPLSEEVVEETYRAVLTDALANDPRKVVLPWIDHDNETREFIRYWFGKEQRDDLRCLSAAIHAKRSETKSPTIERAIDVMKIALSRIIVTKEHGASLARDTSHSRPHRVTNSSTYDVFCGFENAVNTVRERLAKTPPLRTAEVAMGDARSLQLPDRSVDLIITSPPYLNAIDYIRGHRLSLVWLGHGVSELRRIRRDSIGAERAPDGSGKPVSDVIKAMGDAHSLPRRFGKILERYASDLILMMRELARVLKPLGRATVVIGNSFLRGTYIMNSEAILAAAALNGMKLIEACERELPANRRYLPVTEDGPLRKRMTTETILKLELTG